MALLHQIHSQEQKVQAQVLQHRIRRAHLRVKKTLDKTEGVVQNGDTVNIDYTGYLDGTAFKGGSTNGSGADLELGSGTYIDGFEDGIVGHTVGETFDLNLTFPETYPNNP